MWVELLLLGRGSICLPAIDFKRETNLFMVEIVSAAVSDTNAIPFVDHADQPKATPAAIRPAVPNS